MNWVVAISPQTSFTSLWTFHSSNVSVVTVVTKPVSFVENAVCWLCETFRVAFSISDGEGDFFIVCTTTEDKLDRTLVNICTCYGGVSSCTKSSTEVIEDGEVVYVAIVAI